MTLAVLRLDSIPDRGERDACVKLFHRLPGDVYTNPSGEAHRFRGDARDLAAVVDTVDEAIVIGFVVELRIFAAAIARHVVKHLGVLCRKDVGLDDPRIHLTDFRGKLDALLGRSHRLVATDSVDPPDLVIVDGGKGQVSAAKEVLDELGLHDLPLAGLAKEREELFLPGRSTRAA